MIGVGWILRNESSKHEPTFRSSVHPCQLTHLIRYASRRFDVVHLLMVGREGVGVWEGGRGRCSFLFLTHFLGSLLIHPRREVSLPTVLGVFRPSATRRMR